ncbi:MULTISPECIES: sensor histidine kinase [Streptomyces]|uniref:sensor histidine kinase n=1 Tax=Streptomyces TaxID=1883 RepID=UPI000F7749E0|nr:sensor histidine kinase [Streptomyces sp. WAC05858]RSS38651.1 sensor histidine kinase [Streptomyces sp. WAC05858]WTA81390.1 sensor histidine kinase [Streptomyces antimycoticus]
MSGPSSAPAGAAAGPASTAASSTAHESLPKAARRQAGALARALVTPSYPATPLFAQSPRRWLRRVPYGVAMILTTILVPTSAQVLSHDYGVGGGVATLIGIVQSTPLLLSVTRPLQAWWIVFLSDIVCALVVLGTADHLENRVWPWLPGPIIGYLFLLLALALREPRRTLVAVWLVTGTAGLSLGMGFPDKSNGSNVVLFVLSGVVLLVAGALRERGDAQRRLAEQETISEAERAHRTLLEERTRIARELHDVVAHHMSVITVQADSAPYRIGGLPSEAEREFSTIAATARESLAEMRRLLGVLRSEETRGERAPQPGLRQVPQLVEATVRAGIPTTLTIADEVAELEPLPQAVGLSAYRIVQEALANVVRHAPGAATRVAVSAAEDRSALTLLVVNGPPLSAPTKPLETSGTGHGLVGMVERVRLVGGMLDTGPLPDGGFRVAARLPLLDLEETDPS